MQLAVYKYNGKKTIKRKMMFGVWNVHTVIDSENIFRPKRKTVFKARELTHYNTDIVALSETRLLGEGLICKPKGGYIFFWKGKGENEDRIHWVGLAIRTTFHTSFQIFQHIPMNS